MIPANGGGTLLRKLIITFVSANEFINRLRQKIEEHEPHSDADKLHRPGFDKHNAKYWANNDQWANKCFKSMMNSEGKDLRDNTE